MKISRWKGGLGREKLPVYYGDGLAERNYQHGVACVMRIREATLSCKEGDIFIHVKGDGVNMDKCKSSTAWFESMILIITGIELGSWD